MEEKRRAQRDQVLRQRRGITQEQKPLFALGRKDSKIPDMDNDASEMASKRQNLEKTRRFKRHAILKEKRKMENLMESHSSSADLQRTVLATMRKIGELVHDRRRINKDTILKKRRNIISSELEMEKVLQETPSHVSVSSSETEETRNLQREAAQRRIKNNRDWVVQCRRRLFYAKSVVNGNGALRRSKSPAVCISSRKSEKYTGIVSAPNTSLEKDAPADGSLSLGHASSRTSSPREVINIVYSIDIENLQFHKTLGEGQYGKVILASDPVSEELLAVKIMAKSHIQDKIFTELEVLTIAEGCRFLICIRASMETPEEHIIAMDFMAGGDLRDLTEWLPFDIDTTRLFAAEMVCGLQYLHENGVIHRDLKPENVLLDATGHIKIADFGVSAMNVCEEDTVTGLVGTLGYIAPEVLSGEGYNHLVDSFSFGVILYLMTVGFEPFYGQGSVEEYYLSLEEDEPEFPPEMCPDTINFIEGLLCKTPRDRLPITSPIRFHPFFHPINWDDVESGIAPPPFQLDFE